MPISHHGKQATRRATWLHLSFTSSWTRVEGQVRQKDGCDYLCLGSSSSKGGCCVVCVPMKHGGGDGGKGTATRPGGVEVMNGRDEDGG